MTKEKPNPVSDFTISTSYLTITPMKLCEDAQFSPVEMPTDCMARICTGDEELFTQVLNEHGQIAHFWKAIAEMERTHTVILNRRDEVRNLEKERYFLRLGLAANLRMFIHELSALYPDFQKEAVLMFDTEDRKRRKEIAKELARVDIVVKQPKTPFSFSTIFASLVSLCSKN